jgi:hypothetical protein
MLYREIISVCSEIHTKHINTLCGQNVELLSVAVGFKEVTSIKLIHLVSQSFPFLPTCSQ